MICTTTQTSSFISSKVEANSPAIQKSNSLAQSIATEPTTKTSPTIGSEALDDRNFDALQQRYTEILNNESIETIDTLIYQGDSGYYLGGFSGSERDQEEAQRFKRHVSTRIWLLRQQWLQYRYVASW